MLEFIYQKIKYPKLARKQGLEGVVVIRFLLRDNLKTFSGTYYKTINLDGVAKGTIIVNVRHKGKDYQKMIIVQ